MLYNGNPYWINNLFLGVSIYYLIFQYLTGQISLGFLYVNICDGFNFLSVMSSPVYTQIVLILLFCVSGRSGFIKLIYNNTYLIYNYIILITYYIMDMQSCFLVSTLFAAPTFNTNLQNGLLNVHPVLIYITYTYTIYIWYANYIWNTLKFNIISYTYFVMIISFIILIGIVLGSLWASQEFNWGGFWSWDPVELVSLVLFFFCIKIMHNRKRLFHLIPINKILSLAVIIFFIIRLGVVTTIHSFIRTNSIQYYVYIIIICILIVQSFDRNIHTHITYGLSTSGASLIIFRNPYKYIFTSLLWILLAHLLKLILVSLTIFDDIILYLPKMYLILLLYIVYLTGKFPSVYKFKYMHIFKIVILFLSAILIPLYKLPIIMYLVFIVINAETGRYKQLHISMIISYIVFVLFFINAKSWYTTVESYTLAIHSNSFAYNNSILAKYEEGFFLVKKTLILTVKGILQQISGFYLHSNLYYTSFGFSKNKINNILFLHEFILWVAICICIAVISYYIFRSPVRCNFY